MRRNYGSGSTEQPFCFSSFSPCVIANVQNTALLRIAGLGSSASFPMSQLRGTTRCTYVHEDERVSGDACAGQVFEVLVGNAVASEFMFVVFRVDTQSRSLTMSHRDMSGSRALEYLRKLRVLS